MTQWTLDKKEWKWIRPGRESVAVVPPFKDWPLTWDPSYQIGPMSRRGRGRQIDVPLRRCPHGGYWLAEDVAPPVLLNAWGFNVGSPCPKDSGPNSDCARRYREVIR